MNHLVTLQAAVILLLIVLIHIGRAAWDRSRIRRRLTRYVRFDD